MDQISRSLELYRAGFWICAAASAAALALAVFFFFRFRILSVFRMMSGQARAQAVRRTEERYRRNGGEGPRVAGSSAAGSAEERGETFRITEHVVILHFDEQI